MCRNVMQASRDRSVKLVPMRAAMLGPEIQSRETHSPRQTFLGGVPFLREPLVLVQRETKWNLPIDKIKSKG